MIIMPNAKHGAAAVFGSNGITLSPFSSAYPLDLVRRVPCELQECLLIPSTFSVNNEEKIDIHIIITITTHLLLEMF